MSLFTTSFSVLLFFAPNSIIILYRIIIINRLIKISNSDRSANSVIEYISQYRFKVLENDNFETLELPFGDSRDHVTIESYVVCRRKRPNNQVEFIQALCATYLAKFQNECLKCRSSYCSLLILYRYLTLSRLLITTPHSLESPPWIVNFFHILSQRIFKNPSVRPLRAITRNIGC